MADEQGYSDDTYEVEDGYMTHTDPSGRERRLGPGDRFHPTKKQVRDGSLTGKASVAEPATESPQAAGADIGLRALDMTDSALELALDEEVDADDLVDAVEPSGDEGRFWKSDVEEYLDQRGVDEGSGEEG